MGGPPGVTVRRRRQSGGDNGKMGVIVTKMEVIKGHQAFRDFWGWQNCSPPPITHATPLLRLSVNRAPDFELSKGRW